MFIIFSVSAISKTFRLLRFILIFIFFFFNDAATTEIYTLSLHGRSSDLWADPGGQPPAPAITAKSCNRRADLIVDRKSTRLNASHGSISYAVFCWKKK